MDINSCLLMKKLVFNKIEFNRINFKNESSELESKVKIETMKHIDEDIYRIILTFEGEKKNEYSLKVSLLGLFGFESSTEIDDQLKKNLIEKNTVAIMMPYLRSQISLLTAQPDVDCIVLPPFNINNMIDAGE